MDIYQIGMDMLNSFVCDVQFKQLQWLFSWDLWMSGNLLGDAVFSGSNSTATSNVLIRAFKFTKPKISKWKDVNVEADMLGDLREMRLLKEN